MDEPSVVTRYWHMIWRRKLLFFAVVIAALVVAILTTLVQTPIFTATATLEISRQSANIVKVDELQPEVSSVDQEFYQTQYALLESEALIDRVAKQLDLANDPAFIRAFGIEAGGGFFTATNDPKAEEEMVTRQIREALVRNVTIAPMRGSRIVEVNFSSPDPDLSARIANAWIEAFIASNFDRKLESTAFATKFLQGQLGELRGRLEDSERNLVQYANQNRIITLNSGAGKDEASVSGGTIADANLASLNRAYATARAARIAAESRLRAGSPVTGAQNQALNELRRERARLAAEYANMLNAFEPEYPQARALNSEISQIDQAIAAEESRSLESLQRAYNSARDEEDRLREAVSELEERNLDERRLGIQYNIYQREVATNRELYDGLLQRFKEIGLAAGIGPNNIAIVDRARAPENPSSPNLANNILIGLVLGMLGGAACIALVEQLDRKVRNPGDLEQITTYPLLGAIPAIDDPSMAHWGDPKSVLFEAYMSVQTTLRLATESGAPKSLMLTSTGPGEGKSMSCLSLARALRSSGRTVVVVDADLRRPSVHSKLEIENTAGLSEYLAGQTTWQTLLRNSEVGGISIITAGTIPPNPTELLSGHRFEELIAELGQDFDHVLIDSPPLLGLADAPLIAEKTAASIYVIEANNAASQDIRNGLARLSRNAQRIIGVVLTKYEPEGGPLGYGAYAYEYGYGESSSK